MISAKCSLPELMTVRPFCGIFHNFFQSSRRQVLAYLANILLKGFESLRLVDPSASHIAFPLPGTIICGSEYLDGCLLTGDNEAESVHPVAASVSLHSSTRGRTVDTMSAVYNLCAYWGGMVEELWLQVAEVEVELWHSPPAWCKKGKALCKEPAS
ncbi:hypothetical protein ACLKA6_012240 [Drosophila palustris]